MDVPKFTFGAKGVTLDGAQLKGLTKIAIKSLEESSHYELTLTIHAEHDRNC